MTAGSRSAWPATGSFGRSRERKGNPRRARRAERGGGNGPTCRAVRPDVVPARARQRREPGGASAVPWHEGAREEPDPTATATATAATDPSADGDGSGRRRSRRRAGLCARERGDQPQGGRSARSRVRRRQLRRHRRHREGRDLRQQERQGRQSRHAGGTQARDPGRRPRGGPRGQGRVRGRRRLRAGRDGERRGRLRRLPVHDVATTPRRADADRRSPGGRAGDR